MVLKGHKHPEIIVGMAVEKMGSVKAVADALQIDQTTVRRWKNGESRLMGTGLVAIMALITHPEDFARYKESPR